MQGDSLPLSQVDQDARNYNEARKRLVAGKHMVTHSSLSFLQQMKQLPLSLKVSLFLELDDVGRPISRVNTVWAGWKRPIFEERFQSRLLDKSRALIVVQLKGTDLGHQGAFDIQIMRRRPLLQKATRFVIAIRIQ